MANMETSVANNFVEMIGNDLRDMQEKLQQKKEEQRKLNEELTNLEHKYAYNGVTKKQGEINARLKDAENTINKLPKQIYEKMVVLLRFMNNKLNVCLKTLDDKQVNMNRLQEIVDNPLYSELEVILEDDAFMQILGNLNVDIKSRIDKLDLTINEIKHEIKSTTKAIEQLHKDAVAFVEDHKEVIPEANMAQLEQSALGDKNIKERALSISKEISDKEELIKENEKNDLEKVEEIAIEQPINEEISVDELENVQETTELNVPETEYVEIKTPQEQFEEAILNIDTGNLDKKGYKVLVDNLSEPLNYDKYGITTGILNNKAKTILTAMGIYSSKMISDTLKDNKYHYAIDKKKIDKAISITEAASEGNNKRIIFQLKNKNIVGDVLANIANSIKEQSTDELGDEEDKYSKVISCVEVLEGFKISVNAYEQVRKTRRKARWEKVLGKKTDNLLGSDTQISSSTNIIDELEGKVNDEIEQTEINKYGRIIEKVDFNGPGIDG